MPFKVEINIACSFSTWMELFTQENYSTGTCDSAIYATTIPFHLHLSHQEGFNQSVTLSMVQLHSLTLYHLFKICSNLKQNAKTKMFILYCIHPLKISHWFTIGPLCVSYLLHNPFFYMRAVELYYKSAWWQKMSEKKMEKT